MSTCEVVSKIMAIAEDEETGGYLVQFWVGKELSEKSSLSDAFALLGSLDALRREVFTFLVRWEAGEYTMEPDEPLAVCMDIYDRFDTPDELGEYVARQWKTGQIAEAMVTHLVNANCFGVWRTAPESVEGPNINFLAQTVIERGETDSAQTDSAQTDSEAMLESSSVLRQGFLLNDIESDVKNESLSSEELNYESKLTDLAASSSASTGLSANEDRSKSDVSEALALAFASYGSIKAKAN